jgi:hypothetical protein
VREASRERPALAYWAGVAGGLLFAIALGVFARREALVHATDFSGYWAGGRALLVGRDPYDPATWAATTAELGTQPPDTAVYGYFPWVAVAMMPLALLPLETAAWIWCAAGIAVASLGLAALLRARPCPPTAQMAIGFAVFGSQPAMTALIVGQWSLVLTGALAFAVALLQGGRTRRAAATLLLSLAKPQLFVVTIPVLLWRHRGLIGPLAAAGLAVVAVATALMPQWLDAWPRYVPGARITDPPRAAVPAALASLVFGPAGSLVAALAILAIGAIIAVRFGTAGVPALACWLALSSLASPYGWSYDWLVLVVPLVLAISVLAPARPTRATALALVGFGLLTLVASVLYGIAVTRGSEMLSAIVPLAAVLALVAFTWPVARGRP